MSKRRHLQSVLLMTSLFGVSSCYHDFDYQYMSLTKSMEVIEYGEPELFGMREYSEMPIRYKLERDVYTIYALVDTKYSLPTIIFSVESKTANGVNIDIDGIHCFLFLDPIRPLEYERHGYAPGSSRLRWDENSGYPCDRVKAPSSEERIIKVSVFDDGGRGKIAEEEIQFEIKTNGFRRLYDSI